MTDLSKKTCKPCEGGVNPLTPDEAKQLMSQLKGWALNKDNDGISQSFRFKNYYRTMAFVNAVAWIAHEDDHHPDMEVTYNRCRVTYSTHAIGGLSDNDFIRAAKLDALLSHAQE